MEKLFTAAAWIGLGFLAFFAGILIGEYDVQPFRALLKPVYAAADKVLDRPLDRGLLINSGIWNASKTSKTGVTVNRSALTAGGYTLISSGHAQQAFLYDIDGNIVHEWSLPFRAAWPEAPHVDEPADPALIYWRAMHLYPNGDLLVSYEAMSDVRGYGLVKMDADSNVIWTCSERTGGSFCVDENGFIYAVVRRIRSKPLAALPQIVAPFIDDELVVLSPEGEVLRRCSLTDQLVQLVGGRNLTFLDPTPAGALGTESVARVTPKLAAKLPQVEAGDLLIAMKFADMLAVLDKDDLQMKWVSSGPWKRPHCAQASQSGSILVFDNRGFESRGLKSGVLAFDPALKKVTWAYAGNQGRPLSSRRWSSVQELPNGNMLITETQGGRVLEMTPERQAAWEWSSPYRAGNDKAYVACVWGGKRYAAADLDFKFNTGGKKWF